MLLTPVVFGPKHLVGTLAILILIVISLILALKYKKNPKTTLKISASLLIVLELWKYMYVMRQSGSLPSYMFPLQLCSFSLYAMPIIAFGNGRISQFVKPFGYAIGLLSGLLVLALPTTVLGNADFWIPYENDILPYISFLYHGNMIFFSLYLVFSKQYVPKIKDGIVAYGCLAVVAFVVGLVNLYLLTDFMFLRTGNGNPIQFILTNHGYVPYLLTMVILGTILIYSVFFTSVILSKKKKTA